MFLMSNPNDYIPRLDLNIAKNITRHYLGLIYTNSYNITKDKLTKTFKKIYKNVKNIALDFVLFVLYKDGYIKKANYKTINKKEKRIIINKILDYELALREFYRPWPIAIIIRNILRLFN
jgi:hypothetical protein